MTRLYEPSEKQKLMWQRWLADAPAAVREIAKRLDPWSMYRLKTTRQRVVVLGINAEGKLRVNVLGKYNLLVPRFAVGGIDPDELEECEPPGTEEPVGSLMSSEEAMENIDALRVRVRPDLWVLDEHGKAQRKS